MKQKNYTGINRLLKSSAIQSLLNKQADGSLKEFLDEYSKALPDTKMYGLPTIIKAEIKVLKYNSNYKGN